MKSSDSNTPWDGVERREYFRLDDRALLGLEIIERLEDVAPEIGSLQQLEQQISTLLYRVESKHPDIAQLLQLMNQKLNRVAGLDQDPNVSIPDKPVDINLSACGIRFETSVDLEAARFIRLHLTLLPDHMNLVLTSRIVALEASPAAGMTLVRAAFEPVDENNLEVLVQHMMQLQRRQVKATLDAKALAAVPDTAPEAATEKANPPPDQPD